MEVQIRITVLARAIDGHGVHLQVGKDHHRGGAGSARSAEHHGFFASQIEAEGLYEHLESVVIGVVAAKTPVREARYRIDVTHAPRNVRKLIHIGDELFLVGNGDVEALPRIGAYEHFQLIGLALEFTVVKSSELAVYDRGVAVSEYAAQNAVRSFDDIHGCSFVDARG